MRHQSGSAALENRSMRARSHLSLVRINSRLLINFARVDLLQLVHQECSIQNAMVGALTAVHGHGVGAVTSKSHSSATIVPVPAWEIGQAERCGVQVVWNVHDDTSDGLGEVTGSLLHHRDALWICLGNGVRHRVFGDPGDDDQGIEG